MDDDERRYGSPDVREEMAWDRAREVKRRRRCLCVGRAARLL